MTSVPYYVNDILISNLIFHHTVGLPNVSKVDFELCVSGCTKQKAEKIFKTLQGIKKDKVIRTKTKYSVEKYLISLPLPQEYRWHFVDLNKYYKNEQKETPPIVFIIWSDENGNLPGSEPFDKFYKDLQLSTPEISKAIARFK